MEKIKIIFLDIDGVLNGYDNYTYFKYFIFKHIPILREYVKYDDIDEKLVKRLAKICNETNAKVVISSSWRDGLLDNQLNRKTNTESNQLFWKYIDKYHIDVIGKTPTIFIKGRENTRRSDEILAWLSKYQDMYDIESFIILDDEKFDLMCFYGSNLVLTANHNCELIRGDFREHTGLRNIHIKEAINKLNKNV